MCARPELEPASSERLSIRPPASVASETALSATAAGLPVVIDIDAVLTMSRLTSVGTGASFIDGPASGAGADGANPASLWGAAGAEELGECSAAHAGAKTNVATANSATVVRRRCALVCWGISPM